MSASSRIDSFIKFCNRGECAATRILAWQDIQSKPLRTAAHTVIKAQQRQSSDSGSGRECGSEMNGIERANGITGKALTRPVHDLAANT